MTITSLSSSTTSSLALYGLNRANNQIVESTYRLSTGNRLFRAGDDVAALSISTRLQSNITGLRQAQMNNTQADSLLQTAYSGLSEIQDILTTMKARATQANSGSLTPVEQAALDLEFQELRAEIDRLASNTNFNGINLLDGSASSENDLDLTTSSGTAATGSINFTGAIGAGQTVNINGAVFTEGVGGFAAGGSATNTAASLFAALTASTDSRVQAASYQLVGTTIQMTARAGGTLGEQFVINEAASTGAASFVVTGQNTAVANVFALQGGTDNGLAAGGTRVTGTIGDALVNTQSQVVAQQTLTILNNASIANNETISFDDGTGAGTINFRARTATILATTDFLVGATAEETLQNLVSTIRQFSTNSDFVLNQLEYEIQGDSLVIRGRTSGNILDQTGVAASLAEGLGGANVVLSGVSLNNGVNTGVNSAGVTNPDFAGTIQGFTATYNAANDITASIDVGGSTYLARITNTNPGANTTARFTSADGGYFDVELRGGSGMAVAIQNDADTFANRLDAAFSSLTFYQSRPVSSFLGTGQLAGGRANFSSDDFANTTINAIDVIDSTTTGSDAIIEFEIGGETFRSSNLGNGIGANETIRLTSLEDANRFLEIRNGNAAIDISSAASAATLESTLRSNFDLGNGNAAISFQIGFASDDQLSVSINSATSDSLFNGATPDLSSQINAAAAQTVIDAAIDDVTGMMAEVGSAQSRLSYAYNATSSTLIELESARASLADTDIAEESVRYANAIVQSQAAIAVLAQTQALSSNLLDLLEVN